MEEECSLWGWKSPGSLQYVLIIPTYVKCDYLLSVYSAEGKPLSKKALKKQQKDAEKAKKKAETAARLVRLTFEFRIGSVFIVQETFIATQRRHLFDYFFFTGMTFLVSFIHVVLLCNSVIIRTRDKTNIMSCNNSECKIIS